VTAQDRLPEEIAMIIDCHAHVARRMTGFRAPLRYGRVRETDGTESQFFPPSFDPVASPPEMLLAHMDHIGVDMTFLVQHHLYGDQNDTVLDALTRWPDRFRGFAYLGTMDQPDAPDRLERLIARGMTGLKIELASTARLRPDFRFDGEREMRIFERLNALGRPLVIDINGAPPEVVPAVKRVIDTYSRIHLLVCHVGGASEGDWENRARLAKHPRGWIDLAALPLLVERGAEYPFTAAQTYAKWAVDTIGADRVMIGTDYPPTLNGGTYRQLFDWVRRHCAFLTDTQRADILGGTAERFLKAAVG
jgi:L-fuconolactonase